MVNPHADDGASTRRDPAGWEPLDPADPLPDQDSVDLTGWDTYRTEVGIETPWRTDIDLTWDVTNDRLVFHAADRPAITAVLDRFGDAPLHDIDEALDRLWEDEHDHEEDR